MRKYFSKLPRSTEELIRWHERYISPVTLVTGFLIDVIIISAIDLATSTLYLLGHLIFAAASIALFHLIQAGKLRGRIALNVVPFLPSVLQFSFGALFGGFVILYSQSAAYATSWIFIAILAALMIGNERFRTLYTGLSFQAAVYFAVLMSYCVFFLPVIFLRIGTGMFLVSQAVSVAVMLLLIRGYALFAPQTVRAEEWGILRTIAGILLVFNALYFTNAIPPIPLALKDAGVYHSVVRTGDEYRLQAEPLEWYQQYLRYNTVFHRAPGETVYVFTSVFAPARLSTTIRHEWQRYDPGQQKWTTTSVVNFPIQGGRDRGYRGYTLASDTASGQWRVNVRTGDGRLIGRVSFAVEAVPTRVETIEEIR